MKRRVAWSKKALADLADQITYISDDNPDAAQRIAIRIRETAKDLGDFAIGHPGEVDGTYEKSVRRLPYILAYAITDDDRAVTILRVIHTARDRGEDGWPE